MRAVNQWPMVALHHRRKQHEQGRAAALSRLLLCEDPLARPVSSPFRHRAGDRIHRKRHPSKPRMHLLPRHTDPSQQAPDFLVAELYSAIEHSQYHPEREHLGLQYLGSEMGYFEPH